jgi:hypothetical protein
MGFAPWAVHWQPTQPSVVKSRSPVSASPRMPPTGRPPALCALAEQVAKNAATVAAAAPV